MEEVLEAIADNVATLVLAIANSESKGTLFGDMVPATELIHKAVCGMCDAAKLTCESVPEEIKSQIERAADSLKNTTSSLVEYSKKARDDPKNSREHQRGAIRAAKDILKEVVVLVFLEDQSNIYTLVTIIKACAEGTRRLNAVENAAQYGAVLKDLSEEHSEVVSRVKRRAESVKNADHKAQLTTGVDNLLASTQKHWNALKDSLLNPQDPTHHKTAAEASSQVLAALDSIIIIIRTIFKENADYIGTAFSWVPPTSIAQDDVHKYAQEMCHSLESIVPSIATGEAPQRARNMVENSNKLIQSARAVAEDCDDPLKKQFIHQGVSTVEKVTPKIIMQMKSVLAEPKNATELKRLNALIKEAENKVDVLEAAVKGDPKKAVDAQAVALMKTMDAIKRAIAAQDKATFDHTKSQLEEEFDRYIEMAERLALTIEDPVRRQQVLEALEILRKLKPEILAAAQRAFDNPNDPEAQRAFEESLAKARAAISVLTSADEASELIHKNAIDELDALLEALGKAHDPAMVQAAVAHIKALANDIALQSMLAEEALQNIKDPVRAARVRKALEQVNSLLPQLVAASKVCMQNPNDKKAYERMKQLQEQMKIASAELAESLKPSPEELERERALVAERLRNLKRAEAEKAMAVKSAAAKKLEVSGPVQPQIFAAAVKVEESIPAQPALADNSPRGQVVKAGHEIADLMAQLSAFAAQGDRQGMINCSRQIAESVKAVIKNANILAAKVSDPRLKSDIRNYVEACQNFSVQVKIMSAVKAASDENDDTAEDQLVSAATGLSNAVIKCCSACDSASVHKSVKGKV